MKLCSTHTSRRWVYGVSALWCHSRLILVSCFLLVKCGKETLLRKNSSSRMCVLNHNWSATKQRPHPQSAAEISRHSVLSGDRIQQCEEKLKYTYYILDLMLWWWHSRCLDLLTRKVVPETTYNASSWTLNTTIPYRTICVDYVFSKKMHEAESSVGGCGCVSRDRFER